MPVYPHTHLLGLSGPHTVLISGPHIHVFDPTTGNKLHSTAASEEPDAGPEATPIRCAVLDSSGKWLATCGDDKILKVWSLDDLKIENTRELPKRPTCIQFTSNSETILVSDKFGDVFSYALHHYPVDTGSKDKSPSKNVARASHTNPSGGQLVLGHTSMLTTFLLTPDERYIVTADRDEHVRVSWYPQGWCIESFCLGHKKFVSALCISQNCPNVLLSGGGDPFIFVWEWISGRCLSRLDIHDAVQPFICVKVRPGKRTSDDAGAGDLDNEGGMEDEEGNQGGNQAEFSANAGDASDMGPREETVFALSKIVCLSLGAYGGWIIFSAVGASAIHACPLPNVNEGASLGIPHSTKPSVKTFDFGKPVVDFVVDSDPRTCNIWVLLDTGWPQHHGAGERVKPIRVVQWAGSEFEEVDTTPSPLLAAFNSTQCLIPASAEDIEVLDLYNALSSLPKSAYGDADEGSGLVDGSKGPGGSGKHRQAEGPTKRELGRLRSKKNLQKALETGLSVPGSSEPTGKRRREDQDGTGEDEEAQKEQSATPILRP